MNKLGKKFWFALVLFGLIGQVAWVVENMYLNVFIYKMFHASAAQISTMVSASAVAATVTTILVGALTDRVGKRKIFICGGYIIWGITILAFGFVRMDILEPMCGNAAEAAALGVTLVIVLDCVMTFFGSSANDAAYNAWITDAGDENNRGKIEGVNAMMPLISILVVFGGFMGFDLDQSESWVTIYTIIGLVVLVIGFLGIFLIEEVPVRKNEMQKSTYVENLLYSFRIRTIKENKLLYKVIVAFALFGISIQTFMPYLILYYEQTLQMKNYVLVMAPAIVLASVVTVFYGRTYDMMGFQKSVIPCMGMLMGGYVILYFARNIAPVFIGSLLMMCGYLSGMAIFGAVIRQEIPESMSGRFQGIRIIGQVLIPGVIGPSIGAWVLRDAVQIENQDGTFSFLPDQGIWVAATIAAIVVLVSLADIFKMTRTAHHQLMTEAAENGAHKEGWNQYPRPQMRREKYQILNEGWTLNGKPIRLPFVPQSVLSEYEGKIGNVLNYETTFTVSESFDKDRILLHFGGVDQMAEVWLNDTFVGNRQDGYLAFSFDITDLVIRDGENRLLVKATDTLSKKYPYGKQCKKRGGMWYTPMSGIWRTVWLENVPETYVEKVMITSDLEGIKLALNIQQTEEGFGMGREPQESMIKANCGGGKSASTICVEIPLHNGEVIRKQWSLEQSDNIEVYINLADHICADGNKYTPQLWTTESPYLYNMKITVGDDEVETYFALRTIEIQKIDGVNRVCLNGKPIFLHGVLDQGYYCAGIYLPAEPEEYERDILRMKELGLNLLRKHIKVEPEHFYYYCDKHGMLVMQDMVNSGKYSFVFDTALPTIGMKKRGEKRERDNERKEIFKAHTEGVISQLYNHPCIIAYTIFNEGWGQFDSDKMYDYVKELDGSRLVDSTSGWFWQEKNDFDSEHIYFKTIDLEVKERPLFVTECGGYSRPVEGHIYSKYNSYGYGSAKDEAELTEMIVNMYRKMILPGIEKGVCGCVYTQLSDVEDEMNGIYTYDRKVCKVNKEAMQRLSEEMFCAIAGLNQHN